MWPWIVIAVWNATAVAAVLIGATRPQPRRRLRRILVGLAAVLLAFCALTLYSMIRALNVVPPVGIDPQVKASILAEGIAQSINCLISGALVTLLPAALAIVSLRRLPADADWTDAA